jgi:hypothetical protein
VVIIGMRHHIVWQTDTSVLEESVASTFNMHSQTTGSFIPSFLWHVQNVMIPCRSQELFPFLSVMYFFLLPFFTNYSSILSHLILPFLGLPLNLVDPKFILSQAMNKNA